MEYYKKNSVKLWNMATLCGYLAKGVKYDITAYFPFKYPFIIQSSQKHTVELLQAMYTRLFVIPSGVSEGYSNKRTFH